MAAMDEHAAELQQLLEEAWAAPETDWADAEGSPAKQGGLPLFTEAESEELLRQVLRADGEAQEAREMWDVREGREAKVVPMTQVGRRLPWRRIAAAAVVGVLGLGGWWWARPDKRLTETVVQRPAVETVVKPGGNKATLVLANGSTVTLDSTKNGVLATQGTTNVVKVAGGQLAYAGGVADGAGGTAGQTKMAILYNTVRTPKGGQYQVTLPDGSRVWLNAATALRFPTAFTGRERTVELTGEAYFEIAPRKDQPFIVKVHEMTVDVLGTSFDVMAYDDEEIFRTTLLTGAVRVEGGKTAKLLRPGEAARLDTNTKVISVAEADTDQAVAWKNGLFQYEGATLETVMRQVARWYDVDVAYTGKVERHFSGMISRNAPLAEVLHVLERAGKTSFTLEGRTVTIRPK
jgi:transmembrane sensor